jgi:hypothetical protein
MLRSFRLAVPFALALVLIGHAPGKEAKPVIDASWSLASVNGWAKDKQAELAKLDKEGNELVYNKAIEATGKQLRGLIGKEVVWQSEVQKVTTKHVELVSGWAADGRPFKGSSVYGHLFVISGGEKLDLDANLEDRELYGALKIEIGKGIPEANAEKLRAGRVLRFRAKILDAGLGKFRSVIGGQPAVVFHLDSPKAE